MRDVRVHQELRLSRQLLQVRRACGRSTWARRRQRHRERLQRTKPSPPPPVVRHRYFVIEALTRHWSAPARLRLPAPWGGCWRPRWHGRRKHESAVVDGRRRRWHGWPGGGRLGSRRHRGHASPFGTSQHGTSGSWRQSARVGLAREGSAYRTSSAPTPASSAVGIGRWSTGPPGWRSSIGTRG